MAKHYTWDKPFFSSKGELIPPGKPIELGDKEKPAPGMELVKDERSASAKGTGSKASAKKTETKEPEAKEPETFSEIAKADAEAMKAKGAGDTLV